MTNEIKSGQDILQAFFSEITTIEGIDAEIALSIKNLFDQDKLTNITISQELAKLREKKENGES